MLILYDCFFQPFLTLIHEHFLFMKVRYFLLVIRDIYEVRHFSIIILIIEVGLGQLEAVQKVC